MRKVFDFLFNRNSHVGPRSLAELEAMLEAQRKRGPTPAMKELRRRGEKIRAARAKREGGA